MLTDQIVTIPPGNHVGKCAMFCSKPFIQRLMARKPMSQVQAEIEIQNELRRTLNWFQLTAIGLGAIIGVGIYVRSGQAAAQYAGPSVIISFVISGIVAILAALSFSELAAMMSHSGAAYTYTYVALGEYLAWFIGWNYALLYQLSALTVVDAWSKYVVDLINLLSDYNVTKSVVEAKLVEAPINWNETVPNFYITGQAINLPAIAITVAMTLLLISGNRPTAMVNLVLVIIKIIILLIFIFACCKYVNRDNYKPFFPPNEGSYEKYGITGMLKACTYVSLAYVGFDAVSTVAQEARAPIGRSIAFATIASVVISILIYIGICTVMVGLVPYNNLLESDDPLSVAIDATQYGLCLKFMLKIIMNLGAIVALTTVALTTLLSQIRIFYAMANDGLLPPFFARIRSHTPWISTIISGVFCAVISVIFRADILGEAASMAALITYLFVHIEVIIIRFTHKNMQRTFRVPFGLWLIPTLGSLLCILLFTGIKKEAIYVFLVWTAIGQIFYFSYGFWHSKRRPPARDHSVQSTMELLPTVDSTMMQSRRTESESDLASDIIEKDRKESYVTYF